MIYGISGNLHHLIKIVMKYLKIVPLLSLFFISIYGLSQASYPQNQRQKIYLHTDRTFIGTNESVYLRLIFWMQAATGLQIAAKFCMRKY
jgi:hypothetical protein